MQARNAAEQFSTIVVPVAPRGFPCASGNLGLDGETFDGRILGQSARVNGKRVATTRRGQAGYLMANGVSNGWRKLPIVSSTTAGATAFVFGAAVDIDLPGMQMPWSKSEKVGEIDTAAKKGNLVESTEIEKVGDAVGLASEDIGNVGREDMGKSVRVDHQQDGQRLLPGAYMQNLSLGGVFIMLFCCLPYVPMGNGCSKKVRKSYKFLLTKTEK